MPDGSLNLKPDGEIEDALTTLRGGDWAALVTFFDAAVNLHPSSEARLREQMKMSEDEALDDDMKQVVTLYRRLAATGATFQNEIRSQMLELLDDIVHHNVSTQTRFEHLQTLVANFDLYEQDDPRQIVSADFQEKWEELKVIWAEGRPVADAVIVRRRIVRMLTQLAEDAGKRAESATALYTALRTLRDDMSKLEESFKAEAKIFSDKVGSENAEIAALRAEVLSLRALLEGLQSRVDAAKEKAKHPPWYYFIPIVGAIIAIVDVSNMTTEINTALHNILATSTKLQSQQTRKSVIEHLNSMHIGVSEDLLATGSQLHQLIPVVRKFELGWRAIGSDLREIVNLMGDGEGGMVKSEAFDAFDLELALSQAGKEWNAVADIADNFRLYGTSAMNAASADDLPLGAGK